MKKLVCSVLAAFAFVAFAEYQFVEVRGSASGSVGNVKAFDVQSTNSSQTATLKRIRNIVAYTNALDITSRVVTNVVYFPQTIVTNGVTNVVQGVSNVVSTVYTTNGWNKAVAARKCVTNAIVAVTCVNGFATTNVNEWVLKDDLLYVDCADKAAKTTVIIVK